MSNSKIQVTWLSDIDDILLSALLMLSNYLTKND